MQNLQNPFGQMQNLQKSIRTNAELTKVHSDKCRTYKSPFGQMQNLQKSIRTNAELTKVHSDKCRTYKSLFGQMQNLQKSIRTNAELTKVHKSPFGQTTTRKFGQTTTHNSDKCSFACSLNAYLVKFMLFIFFSKKNILL